MLSVNLDVNDGLCNGAMGILDNIVMNKDGEVTLLMVKFDDENTGRDLRNENPSLKAKFPDLTPIKRQLHKYSTSKSLKGERLNVAIVQQFPLILSFALTCHKIQGITIKFPRKVSVDLRSVWGASQAYVMLGRVQKLSQLYIIGSLPRSKIYCDSFALDELSRMKKRSLNENSNSWEQQSNNYLKIAYHNIHSLQNKISDIHADKIFAYSDVLILGETWIMDQDTPSLENFDVSPNNIGRGKGLVVYYKKDMVRVDQIHTDEHLQMSVALHNKIDIIGFYRSGEDRNFTLVLENWIQPRKSYLLIGDMNICSRRDQNHKIFKTLRNLGFTLITNVPTHIQGGHIDQAWIRLQEENCVEYDHAIYSPFYNCTDHDAIIITIKRNLLNESCGKNLHLN